MGNTPAIKNNTLMVHLSDQDQSRTIVEILTRAILISGIRPSEDEIQLMVMEVTELVNSRYKNLTTKEISDTIRSGAMGDFEDSFLTVRNINTWLKSYNEKKMKIAAMQTKREQQDNQMPMAERGSFFLKNIDKIPSLKNLLKKAEGKETLND